MYRFAANIRNRSEKLRSEPATEVAVRPFDRAALTGQSMHEAMSAIVGKATKRGRALNILTPGRPLTRQRASKRDRVA